MKKTMTWMLAAILTFSGMSVLTSCSDNNDNPVDNPTTNTERQRFEQQLSATLDHAVEQAQLDPTIKGIEILTSFVEQLDGEAAGKQGLKIILDILAGAYTERHTCDLLTFADLGDREQEARAALKSLLGLDDASQFIVLNAKRSLGDRHVTFVQGEQEAVITEDDAFVIEYQDVEAGETTELRFYFSDEEDGIILWTTQFSGQPIAIQFPANIQFSLSTGKVGEEREVTSGIAHLVTLDGSKWFLPKETEWVANAAISSNVNGRNEDIVAQLSHDADGAWNVSASLLINHHDVLSLTANGMRDRYAADELDQYADITEISTGYRYAYRLLRAINVRSIDNLSLTIDDDLTFSASVTDVAKVLETLGQVHVLRHTEGVTQADFDPLTQQLCELVTYSASQQSTGITAEGSFLTAFIDDNWQPAPALRFSGEKDFLTMYSRLSQHDLENYHKLLGTFDEPYSSIQDLVKTLEQKAKEIKGAFRF